MNKRKEKWYQTDWAKFVFSAAVSAFFAWIFTFFNPTDESVQVEIEQLRVSTEYLREATQKDTVIVGHLTNQIEQMQKSREKDDLMISVVRQLSGNADTQTIERIKQQVTTYLVTELRKSYLTHDEFAKEKNASKEITRLLASAELARGGDRESYDQLRALLGSTNETAKVDASLSQVVATWNRLKTEEQELLKRARPAKKYVSRFEAYKSSFVRRSRIHFSRYYMTPLIEKGLVARTDPENPMSPRQEYKLT